MPYIKKEQRESIAAGEAPKDAGELNYFITTNLVRYLETKGQNYATLNEIMGVLGCVTQEFYRRFATPYEELKIQENGDIAIPTKIRTDR